MTGSPPVKRGCTGILSGTYIAGFRGFSTPEGFGGSMSSSIINSKNSTQGGFTLVEIAIVLVIIGLLLGGILKGQEMITQAKIKNIVNDFNGVTVAVTSYQDRYRAIPGDDQNATTRWTTQAPASGNGDGVIAVAARRSLGGPARRGVLVVAGNGAVAVLIGGHGYGDAVEVVNNVLDLGLGDHFLPLQDAAQEQPDDHEHDRDFYQGETPLGRILAVDNGRTHATPETLRS